MTRHKFTDRMMLDGALRQTEDGWVAQARVARGGNVQTYLGREMGLIDRKTVRVYRPVDEVFDRKAIQTYARKPITMGHPAGGVSPSSWKDLAVGEIDRDVVRDGEFVSVPLLFRDQSAVDQIMADVGARELSMGYDAAIEFTDGISPSGEPYDAVMSDFRMNHVAVVPQARGGAELRIGDGADTWGARPFTDAEDKEIPMTLRKIMVDGLEVETTDAGATALKKLQDALTASEAKHDKAIADAEARAKADIEAKDEEIGKLKADLKKAEDAAITPEKVSKLVADRVALEASVKLVDAEIKTDGVSDADLRKAAVVKALGDEAVEDASEAEIKGMFKAIAKDAADKAKTDPVATILKDGKPVKPETLDGVYMERNRALQDGWKQPIVKEG